MVNQSEPGLEAQCPYELYRRFFHLDSCPCVGPDTAGEFAGSGVKHEGDTQWGLCAEGRHTAADYEGWDMHVV